jgi:hypothetical protein
LVLLEVTILVQSIQHRDAHPPEEDDLIRSLIREKGELQRRHGHQILIFA